MNNIEADGLLLKRQRLFLMPVLALGHKAAVTQYSPHISTQDTMSTTTLLYVAHAATINEPGAVVGGGTVGISMVPLVTATWPLLSTTTMVKGMPFSSGSTRRGLLPTYNKR